MEARFPWRPIAGKALILYFYPKDDTSGCTMEAIDFSAKLPAFRDAGAVVVGVSPDSTKSHAKFRAKHDLAIPLASDEDKTALEAYGVWVEKSMYGRKYMGVERTTVLIARDGKIARIWPKVKVSGHVDEVLAGREGAIDEGEGTEAVAGSTAAGPRKVRITPTPINAGRRPPTTARARRAPPTASNTARGARRSPPVHAVASSASQGWNVRTPNGMHDVERNESQRREHANDQRPDLRTGRDHQEVEGDDIPQGGEPHEIIVDALRVGPARK